MSPLLCKGQDSLLWRVTNLCQRQENTEGELLLTGKGSWKAECELLCCTYTQHGPISSKCHTVKKC